MLNNKKDNVKYICCVNCKVSSSQLFRGLQFSVTRTKTPSVSVISKLLF